MHLDHESCLEVTVLKGKGAEVQSFANHVIAERGVRHGHVVYVPAPNGMAHSHQPRTCAWPWPFAQAGAAARAMSGGF